MLNVKCAGGVLWLCFEQSAGKVVLMFSFDGASEKVSPVLFVACPVVALVGGYVPDVCLEGDCPNRRKSTLRDCVVW